MTQTASSLSLVDQTKIEKDCRNLIYLYPNMSAFTYRKIADDYYRNKCLKALEIAAAINDNLVVPANCLHWQRKKRHADKKISLFGKSYYVLHPDDLTELELKKYEIYCAEVAADEAETY